ncbi:hypothetical protein [Paraburkholderia sp. RL17-373-BIF-A]|uniref:hypothetical protein n=1 Tax=Paraburkholderia sp. RL17-373-BIF-A TaxID=3031629 RepID=UPI0038BCB1EF
MTLSLTRWLMDGCPNRHIADQEHKKKRPNAHLPKLQTDDANDLVAGATRHDKLTSHGAGSPDNYGELLPSITSRLRLASDLPGAMVEQQIRCISKLSALELGRFRIENRGLNVYATHPLVTHRLGTVSARPISDFEYRILRNCTLYLQPRYVLEFPAAVASLAQTGP